MGKRSGESRPRDREPGIATHVRAMRPDLRDARFGLFFQSKRKGSGALKAKLPTPFFWTVVSSAASPRWHRLEAEVPAREPHHEEPHQQQQADAAAQTNQ